MLSSRFMSPECVTSYRKVKSPITLVSWNALQVLDTPTNLVHRFAKNLRKLIELEKTTVAKVARAAGVQEKQIYNYLDAGHNFRLKGLDGIAKVFGLSAWQMLAIDFTDSPASNKQVLELLELFSKADEAGKQTIMSVARIAAQKG